MSLCSINNKVRARGLRPDEIAAGVEAEEDEKQDGEAPQRGTAVAEEGQRDADDGGDLPAAVGH